VAAVITVRVQCWLNQYTPSLIVPTRAFVLGLKATKKKPDTKHPLGYGKEIYSGRLSCPALFSIGGLFSIYEGIHKMNSPEGLKNL